MNANLHSSQKGACGGGIDVDGTEDYCNDGYMGPCECCHSNIVFIRIHGRFFLCRHWLICRVLQYGYGEDGTVVYDNLAVCARGESLDSHCRHSTVDTTSAERHV